MLARAWRTEAGAAPALLGSMATVRAPGARPGTVEAATALRAALWRERRIEVPVMPFDGALWVRVSAQVFNEAADYERLAAALPALA
jgi:isopenicillin-N epimerase